MNIIINGLTHEVKATTMSFEDVVRLAKESDYASVTYHRAGGPKSDGTLSRGQTVEIQEGTIFNAIVTGNG